MECPHLAFLSDSRFTDHSLHLRGLTRSPRALGLGVPHPTVSESYANRHRPSFKMFVAALMSRSWTAPHSGQVHCRTLKSFVPLFW